MCNPVQNFGLGHICIQTNHNENENIENNEDNYIKTVKQIADIDIWIYNVYGTQSQKIMLSVTHRNVLFKENEISF